MSNEKAPAIVAQKGDKFWLVKPGYQPKLFTATHITERSRYLRVDGVSFPCRSSVSSYGRDEYLEQKWERGAYGRGKARAYAEDNKAGADAYCEELLWRDRRSSLATPLSYNHDFVTEMPLEDVKAIYNVINDARSRWKKTREAKEAASV